MVVWIKEHKALFAMLGRATIALATVLIWRYTGGDTAKIAPFAVAGVLILIVGLIALKHAAPLTLLFLELTFLLIFCYDSYSVFVPYAWLLVAAVPAFVFHLIRLCPRLEPGQSGLPLVAVTVATLLGGVGVLSAKEYFGPSTLAFLLGLGPGLVLCWFWLKNELNGRDREKDIHALLLDLTFWGLTIGVVILLDTLLNRPLYAAYTWENYYNIFRQWNNNAATMLLLSIPAAFGLAKKHPAWYVIGFVLVVAAIGSGSRGAVLFVPIEAAACLLWLWLSEDKHGYRLGRGLLCGLIAIAVAALIPAFWRLALQIGMSGFQHDARLHLLAAAWDDFRAHPLFGVGLAYKGHADLYNGKTGTINWYHVFPAQVIGSMGLIGVLAWGWQLYVRARLSFSVWRREAFALPLCYLGLFLMSMVNPGEFCPIPYAMLAVWFFAWIEPDQKRPDWVFYQKKSPNGVEKEERAPATPPLDTQKSDS